MTQGQDPRLLHFRWILYHWAAVIPVTTRSAKQDQGACLIAPSFLPSPKPPCFVVWNWQEEKQKGKRGLVGRNKWRQKTKTTYFLVFLEWGTRWMVVLYPEMGKSGEYKVTQEYVLGHTKSAISESQETVKLEAVYRWQGCSGVVTAKDKTTDRLALVVQWLRICLPMQATQVWSLFRELRIYQICWNSWSSYYMSS